MRGVSKSLFGVLWSVVSPFFRGLNQVKRAAMLFFGYLNSVEQCSTLKWIVGSFICYFVIDGDWFIGLFGIGIGYFNLAFFLNYYQAVGFE